MPNVSPISRVISGQPVRGFFHHPSQAANDGLVLTHGAGANCEAPLLVAIAEAFCESGWAVLRCDLPFRQLRPHGPPTRGSAEQDQLGIRAAVECLRKEVPGRVLLGGHSYGGRQASMLAATDPGIAGALLLLSYPLHPPKRPIELRTAHFPQLRVPAFFVHGSRDGFGGIEEISTAVKLIPARTEVLPIMSAGHELLTKANRQRLPELVVEGFHRFVSEAGAGSTA